MCAPQYTWNPIKRTICNSCYISLIIVKNVFRSAKFSTNLLHFEGAANYSEIFFYCFSPLSGGMSYCEDNAIKIKIIAAAALSH